MFDFLNSGTLEKLIVESWGKIDRPGKSEKTFTSFINPDEFTINYNVFVENNNIPGKNGTVGNFLGTQPLELTLKFYLDGTKTTGKELDVTAKIKEFYEAVGYDGKEHRTRYLRVRWGKLVLLRSEQYALDCVLKSASVQYKLFKPDGTPLRAIINATFTEANSYEAKEAEEGNKSPDLTHVRVVKEGDTLPGMVYNIYGDMKYYFEVARVNKLDNFRNLQPGTKIFFPPFDKNVKAKKANG
ncbi:MAG: hypothetical protein EPN92_13625 [Chitinophagaceae bacterium]|nr:MAG: hypothetical protein EPN92_13625 [Chitinophagaceae bacterium]